MGRLASLLGRYPRRDQWAAISQRIAAGFDNARKEWFDLCVNQMQSYVECSDTQARALNTTLSGEIVLVLKAYQLGGISGFLASKKYLPRSCAKDFCDLFWAQVGGTELPAVVGILHEFINVAPDGRDFRLARRVAEHLTQKDCALGESMLLEIMVHAFWLFTCISVASAFGDQATEVTHYKLLDAWMADLPEYFRDLSRVINNSAAAA